MLTVLIRDKHTKGGSVEALYEAESVEYSADGWEYSSPGLILNFASGDSSHFGASKTEESLKYVYVMNQHGKTVARYTL